jgi:hypothetical protein
MNDIERLKFRVREEMIKYADRSISEATVITNAMKENNLETYVDIGCWAGTLAKDVLKRHNCKAILVDGCNVFLDMLKENFTEEELSRSSVIECLIVPQHYHGNEMLRIPYKSTGSSTLCGLKNENTDSYCCLVPNLVLDINNFLTRFKIDLSKVFLKFDIEGLDIVVVMDLMNANKILPPGLHFEVHDVKEYYFLKEYYLSRTNYKFPETLPMDHEFWSLSLTMQSYTILGMNPDSTYFVRK